MAGALAHSNLGFGFPELKHDMMFTDYKHSPDGLIELFFSQRVEDDDSYTYCRDEIEGWMGERSTAESIQLHHPDYWKKYVTAITPLRHAKAAAVDGGASNTLLVSRTLHEVVAEVYAEKGNPAKDAAVGLIHHQLATLLGQQSAMSLLDYKEAQDAIISALRQHKEWAATAQPTTPKT
jgi:hypothetical protein